MKLAILLVITTTLVLPAHADTNLPPAFLLDRGAKRIERTAGGWEAIHADGKRERWTRSGDGAWDNGRERFTAWPTGGWFDNRGRVYSRSGSGHTSSPRHVQHFGRETPGTVVAGTNRYSQAGSAFTLEPKRR